MSEVEPIVMRITLVDGGSKVYEFSPDAENRLEFSTRVRELLGKDQVAVQLKDRLVIYPTSRIASIEFIPAPDLAPESVFANAREIG